MTRNRVVFSDINLIRFLVPSFGVALPMALLFLFTTFVHAEDRQVLPRHRSAAEMNFPPVGRLASSTPLDLVIGLRLRNQEALSVLLRQIYDPASSNYHNYLTPAQFAEKFGPTEGDYQAIIAFAKTNGLMVTATHPNRTLLDVRGSVATIQRLFSVNMSVYRHPEEARTFYAPDANPSLDLTVPVLAISGLDNFVVPHPKNLRATPIDKASKAAPKAGSGPGGTYMGNDFRAAYVPGVVLTGTGQMVGLVEFDGYYPNDITAYESQAGLPNVPLTNVLLAGFNGVPTANSLTVGEVSLDIEMAISMAPGLAQVIVYEAGPLGFGNDILNRMATDNLAKQLSCSWNFSTDPNTEQIFQQFAAQGQSFFNASGDVAAYTAGIPTPDDDPYITIVGGTTLTTSGLGSDWVSETTWNQGDGFGSSGGISTAYSIPSWQLGLNMSTNQGSTTMRNVPDVAMTADDIHVIYNNGAAAEFVGTSCAAPLWAGFMALVNQQAVANGQPTAGFINPAIYVIGKGTNHASFLHDITSGNNTSSSSPGRFFAVPGYDLCTGWGTPTGSNLITALATPEPLQITPGRGFLAGGPVGGPFSPAAQSYALSNLGDVPFNWLLANPSAWLTTSPSSGALAPGGPVTTITASLNSAASLLQPGSYTNTVWFTNLQNGVVLDRQFVLQVWPSLVQNGDFETGDFSGWTKSGNFSSCSVATGPLYVHSGNRGAALGPGGSLGYLSQTLPTSAVQPYLLSLWLNSPSGATPNEFLITWNGALVFDQLNLGAIGWTNLQFIVTAAGASTVLRFGFQDDSSFLGLDTISLVTVPLPSFQKVTQVGGAITFIWSALPGLHYQLQYKTNLIQANWAKLGGAIMATDATVGVSSAIGSDPQRFYRVVLSP